METISVIVPVYNVERYLRKCLDSIINQTYSNLEIILVDDGSTDSSGNICDEYAQKDARIKVVHKENGGLSFARNTGLDVCTSGGDFVAFVDSDDWLELDMYERLYEFVDEDCIVCCGYNRIYPDMVIENKISSYTELNTLEFISELLDYERQERTPVGNYFWNKLFPAKCFSEKRFPNGLTYEDIYLSMEIFQIVNKVKILPECKYNYLFRNGSIVQNKNNCFDVVSARIKQENDLKNYPELLKKCFALTISSCLSVYSEYVKGNILLSVNEQNEFKQIINIRLPKLNLNSKYKVFLLKIYLFLYAKPVYNMLLKLRNKIKV